MRTNYSLLALPSAARTATTNSPVIANRRHTGVLVVLSVTAASGTGGLTLKISGQDPTSGNYFDLLVDGSAVTATGTYAFEVNPSDGAAAQGVRAAVSRHLPSAFRVTVTHGDSSSYTYSVTATLIVG